MEYADYLQPCTMESLLRANKLMQGGGSWILRTAVEPRNLSRGLLMSGLVPFLKRLQILEARQLSKYQQRAANRPSSARDRRNLITLRQAPSLLHLSARFPRSQGDDTDRSRFLQAEICETLIKESRASHIRKIPTHEKGQPVLRDQISNSAKRTAALWYLNRLLPRAELRPLLPALKVELELSSLKLDVLQALLDKETSVRKLQPRLAPPSGHPQASILPRRFEREPKLT